MVEVKRIKAPSDIPAEGSYVLVLYGPSAMDREHPRSHDQSMRKTNTSPISINCHQKLSIGRQRKRKKMMPRGPKGEKRSHRRHRHGDYAAKMKFKEERSFASPESCPSFGMRGEPEAY